MPYTELKRTWLGTNLTSPKVLQKAAQLLSKKGPNPFSLFYGQLKETERFRFIEGQVILHYNDPGLARESTSEDAELVMASLLPWKKIVVNKLFPNG